MKRRDFLKNISGSAAAMVVIPAKAFDACLSGSLQVDEESALRSIEKLKGEPAAYTDVKVERGGPRLYLNGKEIYPFFALSTDLYPTIDNFRQAGLNIYHPILGMYSCWLGPDTYDWSVVDVFLGHLLELNPDACFMPRVHINPPIWWKEANPDELIEYGLEAPKSKFDIIRKGDYELSEGGFYYRTSIEMWEASFASQKWRQDTANMLRAFVQHIEESPLRSRMIGYMPTTGRTGEWNSYGPDFIPDYSQPMRRACGTVPDVKERLNTTFGLLRDPQKENRVIQFYQTYHDTIADTALLMCRTIKEETRDRVIVGVFYGYLLEQVRIQEAGYLAMRKFLNSPYIDYIAGPYSYMSGNIKDDRGIRVSTQDSVGNFLGNARGVAGDGGYRMLVESLRRHGKLYFSEMDPSTHLDKNPHQVFGGHGGEGSDTESGSLRIIRRDLGQMFACGVGGWLYDFGPLNQAESGWYASESIIREIKRFVKIGKKRTHLNIAPVSEIAAVYDDRVFSATEHWLAGKPWENFGIRYSDFFNHWFLNAQARSFHRLGAPVDFLYHRDLRPEDAQRYKLIFMVNVFLLDKNQCRRIQQILKNSGSIVVWYYAPGFITPDALSLDQMENLTGFDFTVNRQPGPMLMKMTANQASLPSNLRFGVDTHHWPRFSIADKTAEEYGVWDDMAETAFAAREYSGYHSVYTGTAPLPIPVLRWLANKAGARLWSSESDIVRATEDAAMLVATTSARRSFNLHKPMSAIGDDTARSRHVLDLKKGEVRLFSP